MWSYPFLIWNLMFKLWFALLGGASWTWVLLFCSLYSPFLGALVYFWLAGFHHHHSWWFAKKALEKDWTKWNLGSCQSRTRWGSPMGCQCSSLPGFSFWMKVVGCILYQFVHLLLHDHFTCSAALNLQPANKAQVLNLFFQREEREALTLSVMCSQPLVRCSTRSLSLSLSILLVLWTMTTILNA